jgi:hypothetical protein
MIMNKVITSLKKYVIFVYKLFPFVGGYSVKDAADLMEDPDHYNYRDHSWLKKQDDKLFKK